MKIVHVVNHFMPEFGYQEHFLARAMARAGHEVHVLTSNRAYPDHEEYAIFSERYPEREVPPGVSERDGYRVHRLPAKLEKNLQLVLGGLFDEIDRIDPDLVIMHNFSRYETVRLAFHKKLRHPRWKLLVDDHSLFTFYDPKLFRRAYYAGLRTLYHGLGLLSAIDRIVPVAEECADFLRKVFRVPDRMMTVIGLGADTDLFRRDEAGRARIRQGLGVTDDQCLVAFVGKVVPKRGVHEAYDFMKDLLRENASLRFLIAGSGIDTEYGDSIRAKAKSDGLSDRVLWHPMVAQAEMPALLSAVDVAVWPRQETIAAIEAAACRVPIVVSDNPISKERVSAGNGISCASPAEYQAAIRKLASSPALRAEMGEKGERYVRESYDWAAISRRFLASVGY